MSLDYSLEKCADDVNTNAKVVERFGPTALYYLSMACLACGVPALKTALDCEKLYDRVRMLGWMKNEDNQRSWWEFVTAMQGFSTNASKTTDAQFARQLLDQMKREAEEERRRMVLRMTAKAN